MAQLITIRATGGLGMALMMLPTTLAIVSAIFPESESGRALGIMGRRLGLGTILTVNDPTGLGSVTPKDQSQASWVIDMGH
jgi:MFS family permease